MRVANIAENLGLNVVREPPTGFGVFEVRGEFLGGEFEEEEFFGGFAAARVGG